VVVCLVYVAVAFATNEEHTINIFPTNAAGEGWHGAPLILEQTLSGHAIFDDFNAENSARILYSSDWSTTSPEEVEGVPTPLDTTQAKDGEGRTNSADTLTPATGTPVSIRTMPDVGPLEYTKAALRHAFVEPAYAQDGADGSVATSVAAAASIGDPTQSAHVDTSPTDNTTDAAVQEESVLPVANTAPDVSQEEAAVPEVGQTEDVPPLLDEAAVDTTEGTDTAEEEPAILGGADEQSAVPGTQTAEEGAPAQGQGAPDATAVGGSVGRAQPIVVVRKVRHLRTKT